ncbi:hypothetical protein [Microbacterium sp. zg.Y909]|uniref:hypothetical protein n=1 Tax=Microbacterium sp. zg.Y909 TaxID=2969413 RepID=UPI00214BCE19|nr:hypothetical protein [Microbacterium sp. zg.Y909]MCR2824944.1 hypothetical protein [Microbacterium sp. zg.Y909]
MTDQSPEEKSAAKTPLKRAPGRRTRNDAYRASLAAKQATQLDVLDERQDRKRQGLIALGGVLVSLLIGAIGIYANLEQKSSAEQIASNERARARDDGRRECQMYVAEMADDLGAAAILLEERGTVPARDMAALAEVYLLGSAYCDGVGMLADDRDSDSCIAAYVGVQRAAYGATEAQRESLVTLMNAVGECIDVEVPLELSDEYEIVG